MAVVISDLVAALTTRYEVLFRDSLNESVNIDKATLSRIVMDIDMGDFQGKTLDLNWLGAAPQMREWVDEKRAQGLNDFNLSVEIKRYEASVEIDLDTFKDARSNIYDPRIQEMAQNAGRLEYNLISDLILNGEAATAYDGQFFFDTDHSEGASGTQSNELTGTGTSAAQITTDYYSAYSALLGFKDDQGVQLQANAFRPLVWIPNNATMVQRFEELRDAQLISQTSNVLGGRFDLVVDPRQTDANDWFMFRTDGVMKPFLWINREAAHYEDNFGSADPDVFKRRVGMASVVARGRAAYGMWQKAVKVKNA